MNDETRLVPAQDENALTEEKKTAVPVPLGADELTTKIVAALDRIAALVPDLRKPHPTTAKKVRGARTVSREAVSSIVAMVESSPMLQSLDMLNTVQAHEVLASTDAYRLLGERLDMLCVQVKYTAEARWAEVVAQAMNALHMAGIFAKDSSEAELAAQVATIRRHLGRRNATTGKRKTKTKTKLE